MVFLGKERIKQVSVPWYCFSISIRFPSWMLKTCVSSSGTEGIERISPLFPPARATYMPYWAFGKEASLSLRKLWEEANQAGPEQWVGNSWHCGASAFSELRILSWLADLEIRDYGGKEREEQVNRANTDRMFRMECTSANARTVSSCKAPETWALKLFEEQTMLSHLIFFLCTFLSLN